MHQSGWQKGPRGGPFCRSRSSLAGFGGLILGRDATGTTLALLEAIAVAVHLSTAMAPREGLPKFAHRLGRRNLNSCLRHIPSVSP